MAYALRLWQIGTALWGYLAWRLLVRMGLIHPCLTPPRKLCRIIQQFGTTFVKLGQLLSLRRDILPDEYVVALQALQDRVESFPSVQAWQEVEQAFGMPVAALFAEFEDVPLGAASIAQIHRALLLDGRRVVVKVRRPGIRGEVERDLRLLRVALRTTVLLVPTLQDYHPLELLDELVANLRKELDFRQEARNIARFAEAFQNSKTVYIPAVIDNLYTESVLVQELSGGYDSSAVEVRGGCPCAKRIERARQVAAQRTQHGFELPLGHHGLADLERHLDRSSNRIALAMVTLGLYVAASLLMQHSLGPRLGNIPLLALLGYALALWFMFRLARCICRSGRL